MTRLVALLPSRLRGHYALMALALQEKRSRKAAANPPPPGPWTVQQAEGV